MSVVGEDHWEDDLRRKASSDCVSIDVNGGELASFAVNSAEGLTAGGTFSFAGELWAGLADVGRSTTLAR